MRACPQPIIALGHGAACGGGLSLLLASDVRYAAPSFKANAAYIRIGLGGCDMASSYFLPRLVGPSLARSGERGVGEGGARPCMSGGVAFHLKKKYNSIETTP